MEHCDQTHSAICMELQGWPVGGWTSCQPLLIKARVPGKLGIVCLPLFLLDISIIKSSCRISFPAFPKSSSRLIWFSFTHKKTGDYVSQRQRAAWGRTGFYQTPPAWSAGEELGRAGRHDLPGPVLQSSPLILIKGCRNRTPVLIFAAELYFITCSTKELSWLDMTLCHLLKGLTLTSLTVSYLPKCAQVLVPTRTLPRLMGGLGGQREVWIHHQVWCAPAFAACQRCELKIMNPNPVIFFFCFAALLTTVTEIQQSCG